MKIKYFINGIILLLVLTLTSMRTHSNDWEDVGMAKVDQIQGKYVFVMSNPVQEYEEVGKVNTALSDLANLDKNIHQLAKEMVKKGIKKEEKKDIQSFDAVITKNGKVGILIKFK